MQTSRSSNLHHQRSMQTEQSNDLAPQNQVRAHDDWPVICDHRFSGRPFDRSTQPADVVVSREAHPVEYYRLVNKAKECPLLQLKEPIDDPDHRVYSRDEVFTPGKSVEVPSAGRVNFDASSDFDTISPCFVNFRRSRLALTDESYPSSAWVSLGSTERSGEGNVATVHIAGGYTMIEEAMVRAGPHAYDVGLHISESSAELAVVSPDDVSVHFFGRKPDWAQAVLADESIEERKLRISSGRGNARETAADLWFYAVVGGLVAVNVVLLMCRIYDYSKNSKI